MRRVGDDITLLNRVTTIVGILILLWMPTVWVGDQACDERTASGADSPEWADHLEAEYFVLVGRDSWLDHCREDKAEWSCEAWGMDPIRLGLLEVQMNGRYDDPYRQTLAYRAINSAFATPAFYEPTEEHMDRVIAVDHQGAPIEQRSCHALYAHLPNVKPVCAK